MPEPEDLAGGVEGELPEGDAPTGDSPPDSPESKAEGPVRLEESPEFRRWQAERDREREELRQRLEEVTQIALQSQEERDILARVLSEVDDPDEAERRKQAALKEAEHQRVLRENKQLKDERARQQQVQNWATSWQGAAERAGVDPYSPRITAAIEKAIADGYNDAHITKAIAEELAMSKQADERADELEERRKRAEDIKEREAAGHFAGLDTTGATPPSGAGADEAEYYRKLDELYSKGLRPHQLEQEYLLLKDWAIKKGIRSG